MNCGILKPGMKIQYVSYWPQKNFGKTKKHFGDPFFSYLLKNRYFWKRSIFREKSPRPPRFFRFLSSLFKKICKWFGPFSRKIVQHRNVFLSSQNFFGVNKTHIIDRKSEFAYGALYTCFGIPLFICIKMSPTKTW